MEIEVTNQENNNPKWSLWDLFVVLVILFTVLGFVALLKGYVRALATKAGLDLLFISTFIQDATLICATLLVVGRKGAKPAELGINGRNLLRNILFGILGGMVLSAVIQIIGGIMIQLFGQPPPQNVEGLLAAAVKKGDLLFPFLTVSVLAPISEEIYFRGMLYPALKARWGTNWGLFLSGLGFGLMHMDLYRTIPIAVGGALLAYYYERTGSLVTSILAHSLWNSTMLLSLYLFSQ